MDKQFIEQLHAAMDAAGSSNRSDFIREAIVEKAQKLGIKIPKSLSSAPRRFRKEKVVSTCHSRNEQRSFRSEKGSEARRAKAAQISSETTAQLKASTAAFERLEPSPTPPIAAPNAGDVQPSGGTSQRPMGDFSARAYFDRKLT